MLYWKIRNVFDERQVNWINDQIDRNWREFEDGEVATDDKEWRSAKIANLFDNVESLFLPKLKELIPTACEKLDLSHKMGRIESQVTLSSDGDYYKAHTDTDPKDTRVLTYVYYLHHRPKRFRGGQLRIYPVEGDESNFTDITPEWNSLIFFTSITEHEILPVVSSGKFHDTRRTINGWIHRQPERRKRSGGRSRKHN